MTIYLKLKIEDGREAKINVLQKFMFYTYKFIDSIMIVAIVIELNPPLTINTDHNFIYYATTLKH